MDTLNNIKSQFTIKDLEHLSGIKAHTIRIWEKRYKILEPNRTESNIRYYDGINLKKLLNVTYLYNEGLKISKIAKLSEDDLTEEVRNVAVNSTSENEFSKSLKLATVNFDYNLFEQTYSKLSQEYSFRNIFLNIFIPLLEEIGLMWQSNAITPAHEHFMTKLMMQKLLVNIEAAQKKVERDANKAYVLFLPSNEIHEFGLLYIHYELLSKGLHSIYLGPSVPIEDLRGLKNLFNNVQYISYFTIQPTEDKVLEYLKEFNLNTSNGNEPDLWLSGRLAQNLKKSEVPENVRIFDNLKGFVEVIDQH